MALQLEPSILVESGVCNVTVIRFPGFRLRLGEEMPDPIHNLLLALARESRGADLFLDFGNIVFVTGSTLGALVRLHKELLSQGRNLILGNLSPQVHEVFAVTRLDTFFNLQWEGQEDWESPCSSPCRFPCIVEPLD